MITLWKFLTNIFVHCKLIKKGAYIAASITNLGSFNIYESYKIKVCTVHFLPNLRLSKNYSLN